MKTSDEFVKRPQEVEASGLQNLREALVFRYPELPLSDKKHLYIQGVYHKYFEKNKVKSTSDIISQQILA